MWLDRLNPRFQITLVLSLAVHGLALKLFLPMALHPAAPKEVLREVEYREEAQKPTEMEKLMNRLTAPAKPAPEHSQVRAEAAIAELQKHSFGQVVGLRDRKPAAEVSEADLTRLAALPKLQTALAAPPLQPAATHIALARSQVSPSLVLENNVVPLDELPPADFGPGIAKRGFQQPEMIIKNVKAEKRQSAPPPVKFSLRHDSVISGEVRDREILHQEFPAVPRWLEEKGIEAEVVIRFVVNPDGEVGDKMYVEKTSGYAELDRLGMAALKKFIFAPLALTVRQAEQNGSIVIRFSFSKAGKETP
jgi:TonB family protein